MRRYVDRLSVRGGASFLGWPKLTRTAASAAVRFRCPIRTNGLEPSKDAD